MSMTLRIFTAIGATLLPLVVVGAFSSSCQTSVSGNEGGSEPINDAETQEYKKAIVRCYKTGGTRVVKIMGELRCY